MKRQLLGFDLITGMRQVERKIDRSIYVEETSFILYYDYYGMYYSLYLKICMSINV